MKKKKFKAIKNEAVENKASHKKGSGSLKLALTLFLSYFKIGLFTFGGGYAMIALIEREFVAKKKWITEGELYEIIAISESTPGPLAVNMATFIGCDKLRHVCGIQINEVLGLAHFHGGGVYSVFCDNLSHFGVLRPIYGSYSHCLRLRGDKGGHCRYDNDCGL